MRGGRVQVRKALAARRSIAGRSGGVRLACSPRRIFKCCNGAPKFGLLLPDSFFWAYRRRRRRRRRPRSARGAVHPLRPPCRYGLCVLPLSHALLQRRGRRRQPPPPPARPAPPQRSPLPHPRAPTTLPHSSTGQAPPPGAGQDGLPQGPGRAARPPRRLGRPAPPPLLRPQRRGQEDARDGAAARHFRRGRGEGARLSQPNPHNTSTTRAHPLPP